MKKIKIKGCLQNLSPEVPMLTTLLAAVLLVALRTFQLAKNTDTATGFFLERDVPVYLFFVIAVLVSLATIALCYMCGKMPSGEIAPGRRIFTSIASVLLAAGFGYESLLMLQKLKDTAMHGMSLYESCVANGNVRDLFESIAGLVAMVAFVLLSIACITGFYKWLRFPAVLFLAAPVWGCLRVIFYFTYTISYLVVAELFCELYATICLMLFLFCLARYFTQTGAEDGFWTVVASGLLSSLFCLLASVPRLLVGAVEGFEPDMIFVAGAAFSVVSVLEVIRKGVPAKPIEEENTDATGENGEIPVEPFSMN